MRYFNDPENIDNSYRITRLSSESIITNFPSPGSVGLPITTNPPKGTILYPLLIKPLNDRETEVRPYLALVANESKKMIGHYRFSAYSDARKAYYNPAPDSGDAYWNDLPDKAKWVAGTVGLVCSSFIWAAVKKANEII